MDENKKRARLRGRVLNSKLVTEKMPEGGQEELAQMLYTPKPWLKGDYVQEEGRLYPWEKLLWGSGAMLRNMGEGFAWGRDFLWRTHYGVNPMLIFWQNMFNTLWDGITDPIIGQWMDRNPMKDSTYRWIMRVHHVAWRSTQFLFLLDLGMTPVQRVVFFAVLSAIFNISGTVAGIGGQKFEAGITPLSQERTKLFVWGHMFHKIGYPLVNLPQVMMGFMPDRENWNDYRIYTTGFLATLPLALAGGVVHTFVRNRVTFDHTKNAAHKHEESTSISNAADEKKLTLRESFAVIKHNKFLLYWMIANIFNQMVPTFNSLLVWRFLVPPLRLFGLNVGGPAIPVVLGQFTGLPITFLTPFIRQIVHAVGGPKKTMVYECLLNMGVRTSQFAIGLGSPAAILSHFALDTVRETVQPMAGIANRMLEFEMLDYVEYKTGVRSEGINRSIVGFVEKVVKNNLTSFAGEFFQSWAGVHYMNQLQADEHGVYHMPNDAQAQRFARWALPVWLLGNAVQSLIMLTARASFPYKYGQNVEIEAELAARRAAEAQVREEMEEETTTV